MKKIFFVAIGIVCLMASCTKDSTFENEINPLAGKEVVFTTNTGEASTRTIYGDENKVEGTDGTITTWNYPVYWKAGDKIMVYGEDCAVKTAEYAVSENSEGLNYAVDLNKTGTAGVQWGEAQTSDFFAVYPSTNASFNTDGSINTTISAKQNVVFESIADTDANIVGWVGQAFDTDASKPTMPNAIMYAYTPEAAATDESVDLNFKPFSTVLKIRLGGFSSNLESDTYVNITKITLTADAAIAGDFTITPAYTETNGVGVVSATAKAGSATTNSIEILPILAGGSYLPIQTNQYVEFDVFTLPIEKTIGTSGTWSVKIETAMHGTYTCTLKPTAAKTLAAGKIHKMAIPAVKANNAVTWDYSKWMTQIPKPVYLSELSIPGAWYCMDSGYQNSTDIETLYDAGIRAFNIDCRVSKKNCDDDPYFGWMGAERAWSDENYTDGKGYLACAGTEPAPGIGVSNTQILSGEGQYVSTIISNIINIAKDHPMEYVVVVLTFAEKPFSNSGAIFGTVRPDYITTELNTILNTEDIKEYIYTGVTKDTTIEDVLTSGKNVIVKINHPNVGFATSTSPSFDMPDGVMASFGSMATEDYIQTGVTDIISGLTDATSPYYGYYATMQTYPIYNGKTASGLTYYYHQAQKTSDDETQGNTSYTAVPTLGQRKDAIDDIIDKSTEIYDASTHDAWFQIGIGGSIDGDDPTGVAPLVTYLQGKIENKMITDPSPVGIVLMNHATDADNNPIQLVKDIIEMNAKFYLKREGGDIITGGTETGGTDPGTGEDAGGDQNT